jgi:L-methionine (R)-S-oxide reductase
MFKSTESQAISILQSDESHEHKLLCIARLLSEQIPHYNWVGFYFMNDQTQILELGPYVGIPTDHIRIPYGKGICGQVAVSGETFVVQDVHAQENYISCSINVQSEVVVPIYSNEKLVAQLDIDSDYKSPFTDEDQRFLEGLCEEIGQVWPD